jgi:MFS superfamily sulfate permease-like transporter
MMLLVAAAPSVLRLVPTASLAAILVYTGYKLVNPNNVRRLLSYGGIPVLIYAATVVTIVATDLLTGIITGLGLSLLNVLYALSHMSIDVKEDRWRGSVEVHLKGAATFIRLPQLIDALEHVPRDAEVHVHIQSLNYIDHACVQAIENWERKRNEKDAKTVVEWDELMTKYRRRNQIRAEKTETAPVAVAR